MRPPRQDAHPQSQQHPFWHQRDEGRHAQHTDLSLTQHTRLAPSTGTSRSAGTRLAPWRRAPIALHHNCAPPAPPGPHPRTHTHNATLLAPGTCSSAGTRLAPWGRGPSTTWACWRARARWWCCSPTRPRCWPSSSWPRRVRARAHRSHAAAGERCTSICSCRLLCRASASRAGMSLLHASKPRALPPRHTKNPHSKHSARPVTRQASPAPPSSRATASSSQT